MKKEKLNIIFIIPSLAAGGAERILSFVAQNLNQDKFNTTLLVTGFEKNTVYKLDNLNIVYLNKPRVLKAYFSIFKFLKKEKPDVVISSIVHLNMIIASMSPFFKHTKFVAREANVLSVLNKYNTSSSIFYSEKLITFSYNLVDCILCQSKDMKADVINYFNIPEEKTALINNPITNNFELKPNTKTKNETIRFISIGRLSKEKGHLRIIEALAELDFDFHYTLIGKGVEKENVFKAIDKAGIQDQVTYIEYTKDVDKHLINSHLFLQGSYVEGFPNVLIESCVVGTPVLAFNAPGGLDEIIEVGKNGYIANTKEAYLDYLNAINSNYPFIPETVRNIVVERFNKKKIISKYESLFLNLSNSN
ncbi:glycosyltransferase [Xanthomarina sp. F1114]|uniref:glycosyltransferase n=1 Tax=Xanthomarina sp. F1114 TaxID=2996019 RepID=UPI00225E3D39|nr:glycosyltransferase [Xanthomarina sp. F1114]MCX7548389.1 glycosyltransferase [Xanthomarina sp. F1114]